MYERARQLEAIVGIPSPQKWLAFKSKTLNIGLLSFQSPYHAEHTSSHPITEVKQQ